MDLVQVIIFINLLIWAPLFWIPGYFKLKTISPEFALQSFTFSYFKLQLFWTILFFLWETEIELQFLGAWF